MGAGLKEGAYCLVEFPRSGEENTMEKTGKGRIGGNRSPPGSTPKEKKIKRQ